eukprot:gene9296-14402_t
MGCGASNVQLEGSECEYGPDGERLHEWWVAAEVYPGAVTKAGEVVPEHGPFTNEKHKTHPDSILFSTNPIDRDGKCTQQPVFKFEEAIYSRAFFSYALPSYPVGWARLDLSKDKPHYNTKKVKEKEQAMQAQGLQLDYSKRKKYFLYPESIKEIGIFLWINGKRVVCDAAASCDSWACEPMEGAFFTFTPDRGSVYGGQNGGPETSLALFLRPADSDFERYSDPRWARLHLELLKLFLRAGDGTHAMKLEVRYRYGNWKFVAWNEQDSKNSSKATAYRYSDEERDQEEAVSAAVAKGEFKVVLSKLDLKTLPGEIAKMEG